MNTIENNVINEIVVNKSRFITELIKVYNEDAIFNILRNIKIKYKDATHYCFAYIINNTKRFNDDGEPGGTAGVPILNILENNNLNYVLCVVVRYFGGVKLGAGGLVRTYAKSASMALKTANLLNLIEGYSVTIKFAYENTNYIDQLLKKEVITNKIFDDYITYSFNISIDDYTNIYKQLEQNCIKMTINNNITIEKTN